jgi:hypothetical protein
VVISVQVKAVVGTYEYGRFVRALQTIGPEETREIRIPIPRPRGPSEIPGFIETIEMVFPRSSGARKNPA